MYKKMNVLSCVLVLVIITGCVTSSRKNKLMQKLQITEISYSDFSEQCKKGGDPIAYLQTELVHGGLPHGDFVNFYISSEIVREWQKWQKDSAVVRVEGVPNIRPLGDCSITVDKALDMLGLLTNTKWQATDFGVLIQSQTSNTVEKINIQ